MRLHRLVITGAGPFRDRQEIDFDELTASGLFLIDGATGSGKTTVIDAIVYALFGVVSGGADSDPARMRSHYCGESDPTGVACEFSVDGRRHRITRVPAGARDPEEPDRASTAKPSRQVLTEFGADGTEATVLTKDSQIRPHVEELLGMTAEQFRQLVVLPQGQFAELLRMTPNERLASLASLLGDEFFARVQEDLRVQGGKAEDERRAARHAVDTAGQQLAGRLRSYLDEREPAPEVDFTDPAAGDESRIAAADALISELADQAAVAALARDEQEALAHVARQAATAARDGADTLAKVGHAQAAVATARDELDAADRGIDEGELPARIAALTLLAGSLGDPAQWEQRAPARAEARAGLLAQEARCREEATRLREEKGAIPSRRAELESANAEALKLAGTLPAAAADERRLSVLVDTAAELQRIIPDLDDLLQALTEAEDAEEAAGAAAAMAIDHWEALLQRQRQSQAAQLASTLAAGHECPVCGSTEHPRPAHVADGEALVADADVDEAKAVAVAARMTTTEASGRTAAARRAQQECATALAGLRGALGQQSQSDVASRHAEAVTRRDDAETAAAALPQIGDSLLRLSAREQALDTEISAQDTSAAAASATIAERDVAERERSAQIRALIGEAEDATELLAETMARIASLTDLREAYRELGNAAAAVPPDMRHLTQEEAAALAADAADREAAAAHLLEQLTESASVLSTATQEARPLASRFGSCLVERRAVDERTKAAVDLAALVGAKNSRSLPLRSYALQRRFESVLAAASAHLERMSAGKFAFELSEEVGRGHAGLGIALHDTWTGQRQEPKSLSGGETFYASLSLALGLADVVRAEAGGSALETLFIDEGFGSLDQDTLYQVLDQLDHLRAGNRAVGVVSHVTEMKEAIPDRIEVRRQADSTSIVVRPSSGQP